MQPKIAGCFYFSNKQIWVKAGWNLSSKMILTAKNMQSLKKKLVKKDAVSVRTTVVRQMKEGNNLK